MKSHKKRASHGSVATRSTYIYTTLLLTFALVTGNGLFKSLSVKAVNKNENESTAQSEIRDKEINEIPNTDIAVQKAISDINIESAQTIETATGYVDEKEPNNTFATAQTLAGTNVKVKGQIKFVREITGDNDLDFYSFSANAGDRVYAATYTNQSQGGSGLAGDTTIELLSTNGTTVLELDNDDGSFAATSSTIAGKTLTAAGTYFIKVRHTSASPTTEIQPYDLYFRLQSGSPTPETEPNNDGQTPNPLPMNGWLSGAIDVAADTDTFSLSLNAGDTVYLSLDADPERDGTTWNPRLGFGLFDGFYLFANDGSSTSPNSEALFWTVKTAGVYRVIVDASAGTPAPTFTYMLSVSVHAADTKRTCTTYTSTNVPQTIPVAAGIATSTLAIPDSKKIGNLKVNLNITHSALGELDVSLTAPDGNEVVLFDDPPAATAGTTAPQIDLTLDDEAAMAMSLHGVNKVLTYQPEGLGRLYWFKNQNAAGTWTLNVRDDAGTGSGILNGWGITVCEDPVASCSTQTTIISNDFETNDGGFTHGGTADEWERGLPSFAPITTCKSGTNCWKTDLDNTYNAAPDAAANVTQELSSPNISLAAVPVGQRITFEWAMRYQLEGAHWDHGYVEVREVGNPSNAKRVWEHTGPTMTRTVGSPAVTINTAGGWGVWQADLTEFAGKNVQLIFHIDQDNSNQFAGMAIDDVKVTSCNSGVSFVSVGGRITRADGSGVPNALVTMTTGSITRITLSSSFGYYWFDGVATGANYNFSVRNKFYAFDPQNLVVTTPVTNLDFVAQP